MFYETAQTVGPGWHRSFKPSHYEDMSWSPSTRHFRSPGSSPETYRRIIPENDFQSRGKEYEDEFFNGRRSPTFPRRIFKEWNESSSPNHRFPDRPRMFKRVFKPSRWDDEFDHDIPNLRRVEREFDHFDESRPSSRKFDDDFGKRFHARDLGKDIEKEFEKAEGKVHHIPIMVERRMEDMKSRYGRNSPPRDQDNEEEYSDEWVGPQVHRLRKNFEPESSGFSSRFDHHRDPRVEKQRGYSNTMPETWDPHAVHTLPTRKVHKNSQSFDDSRHTVPPKSVFRSYSETHEDAPRQSQQHSAAFRSHSDGHCPNQTYVTKIEVNLPSQKEREDLRSKYSQKQSECPNGNEAARHQDSSNASRHQEKTEEGTSNQESSGGQSPKPKTKNKFDCPALQQIAVVLQNVEDLIQRVEAYNGFGRDKQYRFLDEMLTRCMLRLDDVDTEGREDIRSARKAAVREVQSCIDMLEAKADERESRKSKNSGHQVESTDDSAKDKEESNEAYTAVTDEEKKNENEEQDMQTKNEKENGTRTTVTEKNTKVSDKDEVTKSSDDEQTKL